MRAASTSAIWRVERSVKERLDAVAKQLNRSKSYLAGAAIEAFVSVQEWQIEGIHDAIRSLDRALRPNPRHPEFYWMLAGFVHQRTGRPDIARELFERIRETNPDMVPPRLALVLRHVEHGELEPARVLVDEILAINPDLTAELALRIYAPAQREPSSAERTLAGWRAAGLP